MATTTAKTDGPRGPTGCGGSLTQRIAAPCGRGADRRRLRLAGVRGDQASREGNLAFIALSGTLNYLDVAAQVGIIGTAVALLMMPASSTSPSARWSASPASSSASA